MTFTQAIKSCFDKYATFSGRASRSEYWWWYLFVFLFTFVVSFVEILVLGPESVVLYLLAVAAIYAPWIAVTARRLHDINRSGWWQLLPLTLIGLPVFIYWMCKKSDEQENRFGPPWQEVEKSASPAII